jgi:hypothetical protein
MFRTLFSACTSLLCSISLLLSLETFCLLYQYSIIQLFLYFHLLQPTSTPSFSLPTYHTRLTHPPTFPPVLSLFATSPPTFNLPPTIFPYYILRSSVVSHSCGFHLFLAILPPSTKSFLFFHSTTLPLSPLQPF